VRTERRLVIDTNLWISRLLMPGGTAAKGVDQGLAWGIPLMSEDTLTELSDVLSRSKFDKHVSREDRQRFLRLIGGIVRVIPVTRKISACRDPRDDKFLDVALNGQARLILTGDKDLLALHPFHGVEILPPADFLSRADGAARGRAVIPSPR
jgi:putative PIN family toxin of toxin-antitoxin system